jgi:flagellar assembly protein FliH
MNANARFLFDQDFGDKRARRDDAEPVVTVAFHEEQMRRAEEAAHLRGVVQGRTEAEADETARLAGATQRLAVAMQDMVEHLNVAVDAIEQQAIDLALAVARRLAGAALERLPTVEIERLVRESFADLRATPHVVVRIEPMLVERMTPVFERIARETGYAGRLVVLGDEAMGASDVKIEWADGGIARDLAALDAGIEALATGPVSSNSERSPS